MTTALQRRKVSMRMNPFSCNYKETLQIINNRNPLTPSPSKQDDGQARIVLTAAVQTSNDTTQSDTFYYSILKFVDHYR